jgi:hypothetical protein
MPIPNLHLTALEVTHSVGAPEIASFLSLLEPMIPAVVDLSNIPRLIKPFLSHDTAALALSFLPAAGEALSSHPTSNSEVRSRQAADDVYTYHHLRRDVYGTVRSSGIDIGSRYVVPSAHITIARFITQNDHDSQAKIMAWVKEIDGINKWLEEEVWPRLEVSQENGEVRDGEWIIGQDQGLILRKGVLWYGGGETVQIGKVLRSGLQ